MRLIRIYNGFFCFFFQITAIPEYSPTTPLPINNPTHFSEIKKAINNVTSQAREEKLFF